MASSEPLQLTIANPNGSSTTFALSGSAILSVRRTGDKKWSHVEVPVRQVLYAEVTPDNALEMSLLARKKKKGPLSLVHISGHVQETEQAAAASFVTELMQAAYDGVEPRRRLKVLVNPKSGPGKSVSLYHDKVEPILKAARCTVDLTITSHSLHALEIAKDLSLDRYDAVATMSGDGLVFEVVNGFAKHAEPMKAFRIPITPIPSGSGNGLALNILGLKDGYDVTVAALNAVKGRPMSIDMFSVTQGDQRIFSFFSQAVGLMADLDLGTEHLRFLGSTRFVVGFLQAVAKNKKCPIKLHMKVVESDKVRMVEQLHAARSENLPTSIANAGERETSDLAAEQSNGESPLSSALPELKYSNADTKDWVTFDKPILYVYAGKGPFVSRDLMQFPVSLPNDGLIDIVVQEVSTRGQMLKAMDGAEKGAQFWMDTQHYFKAEAYRVEPTSSKGLLSVDGEAYPFEPFTVEVHKGLATLLSPCGYYQADFDLPRRRAPAIATNTR
ncbi:hypothetical protein OBBRIDRAFT_788712 [Obba rivulosa]|uniref:DAGKc domain-containing protein n=1 Tax=Obba rivulosa TaxID=1052685 RepID=A0A8E2DS92_9APHY|nr:hypothetical protein OBBRIDRAFT_788712 [Obba rivulosa]